METACHPGTASFLNSLASHQCFQQTPPLRRPPPHRPTAHPPTTQPPHYSTGQESKHGAFRGQEREHPSLFVLALRGWSSCSCVASSPPTVALCSFLPLTSVAGWLPSRQGRGVCRASLLDEGIFNASVTVNCFLVPPRSAGGGIPLSPVSLRNALGVSSHAGEGDTRDKQDCGEKNVFCFFVFLF